ncbi:MAG: hypothetical protein AMR96_00670 [Candidatus Adiutrix intracellularis]|jgi:XTP/dITP diphosphohydrolase|nr:MAG: hypothetical protein AMR96_00670 [Candidatus Adiutrix intracellularis]MDR2827677.1 non-canonical purine NTP pyrophosphatase [Candidatus Adiutrix intracellularis]
MNKPKILIATRNQAKVAELAALVPLTAKLISLAEWETETGRRLETPRENGQTFTANALIKARAGAKATGLFTLADDSGLSVLALGGAPGIFSARFGGEKLSDRQRCHLLLSRMKGRHDRRAFFTTVLALARPDDSHFYWRGQLNGFITIRPIGDYGFGYDAIFRPAGFSLTLAQLTLDRKNSISHRALALKAFQNDITTCYSTHKKS